MIIVVCSVRDAKAEVFGQPHFTQSVGTAIRSFTDEINREAPENSFFRHPEDYTLYQLGTYDDSNGRFDNLETPKLLVLGNEVKEFKPSKVTHISKV